MHVFSHVQLSFVNPFDSVGLSHSLIHGIFQPRTLSAALYISYLEDLPNPGIINARSRGFCWWWILYH